MAEGYGPLNKSDGLTIERCITVSIIALERQIDRQTLAAVKEAMEAEITALKSLRAKVAANVTK